MNGYYSVVLPRTVRIHMNGWARLSSDLVPDGAEWLLVDVDKDRHHIILRTVREPEARAIKLDYHDGRRKSPVFWFRPWLFELGIATCKAVGTYSAVGRGRDRVVFDLKKPLCSKVGRSKPSRRKRSRTSYRPGSARFRATKLCCRPQGATVAEIAKIADELDVQLKPLLRSMRSESIHGYRVELGPRNSIKLKAR